MIKKDIVFCILQYSGVNDTDDCIQSIMSKCNDINYHIIVVDNCSPDGSFEELSKIYSDNSSITLIKTNDNLGYAKGNNTAIEYARNHFDSKFIVVLNNDIILIEDDLYTKLLKEYSYSKFAVLGPLIYTNDGRYTSNPVRKNIYSRNDVIKRIIREGCLYLISLIDIFGLIRFLRKLRVSLFKKEKKLDCQLYLQRNENVQLHGSFLVFTSDFFDKLNGFDSRTFMYMEEYFLIKHCMENNLKTVYTNDIRVFHKEDVSTNLTLKTNRKKEIFLHKNSLYSARQLLKLYDYYSK